MCKGNQLKLLKEYDNGQIFECNRCRLVSINSYIKSRSNLDHIYNLSEYQRQEGPIRSRLGKFVDLVASIKSNASVLEIGPGFGLLSSMLLKKGNYNLDIVEPSLNPHYLRDKKFTLHKMNLQHFLSINKKKYDTIIMFDVIEHFDNPEGVMVKLVKLLNKNGIIVIQTPNYRSFMQILVKEWSWWMFEDHKWIYSAKSMKQLLKKSELEVTHFSTYEDWNDFKKNLDGNFSGISNIYIRKSIKALFFSLFIPFYFLFRPFIWSNGYGGLIFAIADKNRDY